MSRELFDYLTREKIADGPLIAKWRKPGYEILCSMLAVQKGNHNFGTTSHCRVPLSKRAGQQRITPDVQIGCISCASGDGRFGGPVWCVAASPPTQRLRGSSRGLHAVCSCFLLS